MHAHGTIIFANFHKRTRVHLQIKSVYHLKEIVKITLCKIKAVYSIGNNLNLYVHIDVFLVIMVCTCIGSRFIQIFFCYRKDLQMTPFM